MSSERPTLSAELTRPTALFPGDQRISPERYVRSILNGYVTSTATFQGAAEGYKIPVDSQTFERWKRLGAAAGLLDDFLDTSHTSTERHDLYQQGLAAVLASEAILPPPDDAEDTLGVAVYLLYNSTRKLPDHQQERLFTAAKRLGELASEKARCRTVDAYIETLGEESALSSVLIYESADEHMRIHPRFAAFAAWCTYAVHLGVMADSARDLWKDARAGRLLLPPTTSNSAHILQHTLPATRYLLHPNNWGATAGAIIARGKFSLLPTAPALALRRTVLRR